MIEGSCLCGAVRFRSERMSDIAARIVAHEHTGAKISWENDDNAPHFDGPYPGWENLRP